MDCLPPDQLPPSPAPLCFLNLNWDQSIDAAAAAGHLDSVLSSMVSSPASNCPAVAATDGLALHRILSQPHFVGTPLSSPPKLNLSMMGDPFHHYLPLPQLGSAGVGGPLVLENLMPMGHLDQLLADPGLVERAVRLSDFDGQGSALPGQQFSLPDSRQAGSLKELELGNSRDESSVSDLVSAGVDMSLKGPSNSNARKRKAPTKGKGKDGSMATLLHSGSQGVCKMHSQLHRVL